MNKERQQRLQQRVMRDKTLEITSADELSKQQTVVFTKHFFIEPQFTDDGDGFAIYRQSDLTSVHLSGDGATPDPVHVCDSAVDAALIAARLDVLVDGEEMEDDGYVSDVDELINGAKFEPDSPKVTTG